MNTEEIIQDTDRHHNLHKYAYKGFKCKDSKRT